jgi:hypothetical protein
VKKWLMWVVTAICLAVSVVCLMWAVQTAWLGSFPGRDQSKYSIWAALQLGGCVAFAAIPLGLWIRYWLRRRSGH